MLNAENGYAKEYVDGVLTSTMSLPQSASFLLNGQNPRSSFDYIGRNFLGTGPGLSAAMDEFRIWYGELSPAVIYKNFIVGVDPSHVTLSSSLTMTDVKITFKATSTQRLNIGLYGGSAQYSMFGSETKFMVAAADPQCAYKTVLPLNSATSSVVADLAAMNYKVSLYESLAPAPVFSDAACDPTNPTVTNCFCDGSKTPYQYLSDADKLSQSVAIPLVNGTTINVNFIYHTGVCAEVIGSSNFATAEGDTTLVNTQACFPSTATTMTKGEKKQLKVVLFERYPEAGSPPIWFNDAGSAKTVSGDTTVVDFSVDNAEITITDIVSGKADPTRIPYDSTMVLPNALATVKVPVGVSYQILAGDPLPISPFDLPFQVTAERNGDDGVSTVTKS